MFAERWTPIILRNLGAGCSTFTQIREGAPGISKALLAERLEILERHGIISRDRQPTGRGYRYELTESGQELKRVCDAMGEWGARWLEIEPRHVDPTYVLWATCRLVDLDRVPAEGVVVRFDMMDEPRRRVWMRLQRPRSEVCTSYPGRTEDVIVTTDAQALVDWNLRRLTLDEAAGAGRIRLEGPPRLTRQLATWFKPSPFAGMPAARQSPVA